MQSYDTIPLYEKLRYMLLESFPHNTRKHLPREQSHVWQGELLVDYAITYCGDQHHLVRSNGAAEPVSVLNI